MSDLEAMISDNVVSSTNLWTDTHVLRSLINIWKTYGSSHEPCGMPPLSLSQSEKVSDFYSLLSIRQEWMEPTANKLWDSQLGQLLQHNREVNVIKRFCKVHKHDLNWRCVLSSAWCQVCRMSISACTVERPRRPPNCFSSNLSPNKDSRRNLK